MVEFIFQKEIIPRDQPRSNGLALEFFDSIVPVPALFEMQSARSKSAWSARAARDDGGRLPPSSEQQRSSTLQVQQQRVLI